MTEQEPQESPVVLVTGASRGIGAATARLAAARGWDVVIGYARREDEASDVVRQVEALGHTAIAVRADVGDPAQVEALFAAVAQRFGRLDALVNNAGILFRQGPLASMDADRITRVFAVNVVGAFLCAQHAVRLMATSSGGKGGCIVNISSGAAKHGAGGVYVDYAASKAALDAFTLGLATEVAAEGIRVNGVRPGVIRTEIHADGGDPGRAETAGRRALLGRPGEPEEIAEAVLWLLSPASSYVTGAILDVTGGR